jgi:hypothetical protein
MIPKLLIKKRMVLTHGKLRPVIEVKAEIALAERAFLIEHCPNEQLFKRTAYAGGFTDGGLQASPPLVRMLNHFVKNDACPEITAKTLLMGQKYEGSGVWDILCFDFIAKRAFDALVELAAGVRGFDAAAETYLGFGATPDLAAFAADTASEMAAGPAAVAVGGVQGMADAA